MEKSREENLSEKLGGKRDGAPMDSREFATTAMNLDIARNGARRAKEEQEEK